MADKVKEILERSISKIYPSKKSFEDILKSGKKITIYHGIDPTGPELHLGHSTNLLLLKRLQEMGHKIILLVGDFTAQIGDPTDKLAVRKSISEEDVLKNCETYKEQAAKILDFSSKKNPVEMVFNGDWYSKMGAKEFLGITKKITVQRLLERDMFQERIKKGKDITVLEFLYPLMQGYDSVVLKSDVEVGGTDQTFNMLMGRTLMKRYLGKEKLVITTRLLENPKNGKKLMSKSEGSYIALTDSSKDMYGKTMFLPDEVIIDCLEMCTELPMAEVKKIETNLKKGLNPRDAKARLAREIVGLYHGSQAAKEAEAEFEKVFAKKEAPSEVPVFKTSKKEYNIVDLLVEAKLAVSKSEARRLISQGGVKVGNKKITDQNKLIKITKNILVQVGKRKFLEVTLR